MSLLMFNILFITPVGVALIWLLWKKHFKDAVVFTLLTGSAYLLWYRAMINEPWIIVTFLLKFFDALKGWWG